MKEDRSQRAAISRTYPRWVVRSTLAPIRDRWSAVVEVWYSERPIGDLAEVVPFDDLYENRNHAYVAGLERGKRWIDQRVDSDRSHD